MDKVGHYEQIVLCPTPLSPFQVFKIIIRTFNPHFLTPPVFKKGLTLFIFNNNVKDCNMKKNYPILPEENKNTLPKDEVLDLMPWELIEDFRAFVFDKTENKKVRIAALDPDNKGLRQFAKKRFGNNVEWFQATEEEISNVLKKQGLTFKEEISKLAQSAHLSNDNIVKLVDRIIKYSIDEKASDIHIEPTRKEIYVRYRIDGILYKILSLSKNLHQAIMARLKILSNLKIDEYRRPQDGRIEPEGMENTSLRISIIPTLFGEKAALRVLDNYQRSLSIEEMGFSEKQKNIILENINKPFGMILVSGPTGSGKTTTLYALLQIIKKEGLNISTLEDPIEYILDGVNQIQINPRAELTFPNGLRALLRQDPDIMMVGEVRDSDTAIMATNAAMTGHLVFTTLHTNDAASAFTRLLEMKVDDFVVASTINLVIAQRLVRKVCTHCGEKTKLDPIIIKKIKDRKDIMEKMEKREQGLSETFEELSFNKGKGCETCLNSGYLGRVGIFELIKPDKKIHDLILTHSPAEKIRSAAEKMDFPDIVSDGVDKVFKGITTFDEVLRTTKNV